MRTAIIKTLFLRRIPALIAMLFLFQSTAFAHTALKESTPADEAVIATPPANIALTFTEDVRLVKFELLGTGHEMETEFKPDQQTKSSFEIVTPGMHPGKFTVNWTVLGADGHAISESFTFTVDPAAK